jgi:hypothetical protein
MHHLCSKTAGLRFVEVRVLLRRRFFGFVVIVGLISTPAWAGSKRADETRARATKLAKEGRTLEAASELRIGAETAGPDGPALRFEAALMLQRSGELRDAISLHDEVSRDSNTDFDLRVQARYAEELLFWSLEFSSLATPSLERLTALRERLSESVRRNEDIRAEDADLAKRLSQAVSEITESRRTLSAVLGPDEPTVKELDGLIQACAEQQRAVPSLKKSTSAVSRAITAATRAMGPINKGIDALSAFAKQQVDWLKRGEGSLRALKKQHQGLLKKGSRVAQGAVGKLSDVDSAISRANQALDERERVAREIQGVVSAAEIFLGAGH